MARTERLLAHNGVQPAVSADGREIVFQNGNNVLMMMRIDGSGRRAIRLYTQQGIFTRPLEVEYPSFSPDGTQIVFDDPNSPSIYVVNVDGSGLKRIVEFPEPANPGPNTQGPVNPIEPVFAPDGKSILFDEQQCAGEAGTYRCHSRLAVMNPDGTHIRRIANTGRAQSASFSPSGRTIVFVRGNGIFRMSLDGSNLRRLTTAPAGAEDITPAFSADGRLIVFERLAPSINFDHLMIMHADGSHLHQLNYEAPGMIRGESWAGLLLVAAVLT